MKSLKLTREGRVELLLLEAIVLDAGLRCGRDLARDMIYLQGRISKEGLGFLYHRLPVLADALQKGIDQGRIGEIPQGWKKNGCLPRFLFSLWEGIFDPTTGSLVDDPCPDCILSIRQITRLFKKIEVKVDPERERQAYEKFVETERELSLWASQARSRGFRQGREFALFGHIGDLLWTRALRSLDQEVANATLSPRHGGGSTQDRLRGNAKYANPNWPGRLERVFPSSAYLVSDLGAGGGLERIEFVADEPCVRVTAVPKTPVTPRIIAVEPTAMQYVQQSLRRGLYDAIEQSKTLNGVIGFRDQTRNREAARVGSICGSIATIDLAEASDRVHCWLVARMFKYLPDLRAALFISRSPYAKVPGYSEPLKLEKFASMGSATCFPIETMCFLQIILTAACWDRRWRTPDCVSYEDLVRIMDQDHITVFGDDICCSADIASTVCDFLEDFGLKVNRSKSYMTNAVNDYGRSSVCGMVGTFRESCGADWFDGYDVKPVYLRQPLPVSHRDAKFIMATVATSDQLFDKGWWLASDFLRHILNSILGPLPLGDESLGCLRFAYRQRKLVGKKLWDPNIHAWKYKVWKAGPKVQEDPLSGYPALMKFHLQAEDSNLGEPNPLQQGDLFSDRSADLDESDVPYSTKLYREWLSA